MTLTPADVHNVAFSRSHLGKRGYSEQEVDLFIDLVEQELTRHIEEDAELRNRNAEFRNRDGGLHKREMEIAERETELAQQQIALRQYEGRVRHQDGHLHQLEAEYAQREAILVQKETELCQREAQLAQQESELLRWANELRQQEAEIAQQESEVELRQQQDQQEPGAACVSAEPTSHQVLQPYRAATQIRAPVGPTATVNGVGHREEVRTVAAMTGRHDMERMAVRAVTDVLGNTITETVHERLRGSHIDPTPNGDSEPSSELQQLKERNADLNRSNELLKAAAALLAAALEKD